MISKTEFLTDTKITLLCPLTLGTGEVLHELTMRVPTRSDIRKSHRHSKDPIESENFLFAHLTGLTLEDIDALIVADSNQLTKTFRRLCGESADES